MKRIFSGIQPSGVLHIGNYIGAIKQFVQMQEDGECIFCVVDLHAITVPQDPEQLKKNILSVAAMYIACGIDPNKSTIFVQSDRPEHSELAVILNCYMKMGQLRRLTQYKEKSGVLGDATFRSKDGNISITIFILGSDTIEDVYARFAESCKTIEMPRFLEMNEVAGQLQENNISLEPLSVGLFDYPVLMAADILLYQTTDVPIGDDQKQHLEITRNIAERINNKYGKLFVVPNPIIKKSGARIMGLDDPSKKMSKSAESVLNYIALTDDAETIRNKVKKAVTDSGSEIKSGADKPALTNLLTIYSEITDKTVDELEKEFEGKQYGEFKDALAEEIVKFLAPIQEKYKSLMAEPDKLRQIMIDGAKKIEPIAQATLKETKNKIGLG